jgi:hypothetical protein
MRLLKIIIAPRRTACELLAERTLTWPLAIVLALGLISSISFYISYLQHAYPPPQEMIEAWGTFSMLPFFNIPAESYRLFLAEIMVPFLLGIWILMAGSARLISILLGGKVTYRQYLVLFAYSFFSFYLIASILDTIYSGLMFPMIMSALRGEYGPLVRQGFILYPAFFWVTALGMAGIYNGIVCQEGEGWAVWKSVLVAVVTFVWPMVAISFTLR